MSINKNFLHKVIMCSLLTTHNFYEHPSPTNISFYKILKLFSYVEQSDWTTAIFYFKHETIK